MEDAFYYYLLFMFLSKAYDENHVILRIFGHYIILGPVACESNSYDFTSRNPPPSTNIVVREEASAAMATQKAVIIESKGLAKVSEVPFPTLRDDYIIVRTKAVALNPTDWK